MKGYRCPFPGGQRGGRVKLTSRLHLVLMIRISETIPLLPFSSFMARTGNFTSCNAHFTFSYHNRGNLASYSPKDLKILLEEHRKMNWKVRLRLDRSVSISNCQEKYTIAVSFQAKVPVFSWPLPPARPWQPSNLQPQVAEIKQRIY